MSSPLMPSVSLYVITRGTKDKGDKYVVREHVIGADDHEIARYCTEHETLEAARASVPGGLARVPRAALDDAVIVETWGP